MADLGNSWIILGGFEAEKVVILYALALMFESIIDSREVAGGGLLN